ncbi:unnamed protein product [Menidia menidia]|uniref:(Atlantic silverside) hypothetical protein n=1 Tax=Menidia menidia TaxID=238744 RepID=A0A8S4AJQ8_9TELE|nr:unnamed protein product [Menidia menidia]
MANVKVAIRVRPLNSRESTDGGRLAVQVEDKLVRIRNMKLDSRIEGAVDSREKLLEFCFDYCYWSVDPADPNYASQEEVFQDLGVSVLSGASEGYNVCLFAYGQTGSGKTYTMMGTPDSIGLTPRICQGLFRAEHAFPDQQNSSRVEISFLEIYNERVRDLLRGGEQKKRTSLRVREHPEKGPYVQDLSQHVVSDCKQALDLLEEGIANRITAATHNHDASSRSHAIFTIQYTQAILENNLPSETVSKINLVDLAGSERADPHYCRDRLTEGSNINKSLVTLGIVISALAQNSHMSSSCQSINSVASEGDSSTVGSHSSSLSGGGGGRRHCFIPYRDSVLTWLLKDSLGGNSKTIMIATVSPSANSYNETLSTLRYAAHARNIVNKPRVNEDVNVRLIRELREEIDRLKSMLLSFEMQRNPSPSLSDERDGNLSEIVLQNELKVEQLTKDWSESWRDKKELLEQYGVDINRDRASFLINSLQPHLVALDRDVLSTGVVFYHLREGITYIGPQDHFDEPQIVLQGSASCEIENHGGVVTLRPLPGCICLLNDREVIEPCRLAQGTVITLGGVHKFRFNHPAEAAVLRERRRTSEGGMTCSYIDFCRLTPDNSVKELKLPEQLGDCFSSTEEPTVRERVEEQKHFVERLRQEIQAEQRQAERELEREQAYLRQQHTEIQQWILQEKHRLSFVEQKVTRESGVQADLLPAPLLEKLTSQVFRDQGEVSVERPSLVVRARKKAVQDELLKHHSLCRAESRIRRKKLHYQLRRIANKRHLLDAKRALQQLEKSLPSGADSPESPELQSPSHLKESPFGPRRHSFSADLLSRLYPQHTPIFKKPPPVVKGGRVLRPLGRIAGNFFWRQRGEKSLKDKIMSQSKAVIKTAVSCEELDQRTMTESVRQRRRHSTGALMSKTSRWIDRQQALLGWEENQEDRDEGTSDCESLFSLDSLSSAYATALAERLRSEDTALSETESEDSEMSKDSLTTENTMKFSKVHRGDSVEDIWPDGNNNTSGSNQEQWAKEPNSLGLDFKFRTESGDFCADSYNPSPVSEERTPLKEDDVISVVPSECNTDVLVNMEPSISVLPRQDQQTVPEDLPMHNKFFNWSGVNQQSKSLNKVRTLLRGGLRHCVEWGEVESAAEAASQCGRRAEEITKLRQEREQVMAAFNLSSNPTPLTVELTEAKLHYGLGETDALLKMLSPRTKEEQQPPTSAPTKKQLYDRHRRSIEGLRQEREERLQTYRRARSLSPSKHPRSSPQEAVSSAKGSAALPSRRIEYLQRLRQEVIDSTRLPDPQREEGQYPSDIEQLLRDYGRAREEARTEIAKARERLRERTELEKKRLQQQALSQEMKRTASFGSSMSISASYQDITSGLLSQALAEVRLASFGDLGNLVMGKATAGWRYQGEERGTQAYYKSSSCPSVHCFLGVGELDRPLDSLWNTICQMSKAHMYNQSVRSVWTRPLDDSTQLVYILTDPSACHLSQPRDFCCISTKSKQGGLCVLSMQSVFEESLPRPSVDAIRGEMMPSCWILQPVTRSGQEVTRVIYMLQRLVSMPLKRSRVLYHPEPVSAHLLLLEFAGLAESVLRKIRSVGDTFACVRLVVDTIFCPIRSLPFFTRST